MRTRTTAKIRIEEVKSVDSDKKLLASHVQEILGTASFTLLNEVYEINLKLC